MPTVWLDSTGQCIKIEDCMNSLHVVQQSTDSAQRP